MLSRLLATLCFWLLMAVLIPGAVVVVLCFYFPFVALKGVWMKLSGRLDEARGKAPAADADGKAQPRHGAF